MKISKNSLGWHIIGLILFVLSFVLNEIRTIGFEFLVFGLCILCLCWIIGIEQDIYKKENKTNEQQGR